MMSDSKDDYHCPLCGCRLIWMPVSHIFVCESCKQSFDEIAEFYFRPPTIEKSSSVGNAAAMREALETIHDKVNGLDEECGVDPVEIRDIARAALAASARNCDVGTPEEQVERFKEYCLSNMLYYRDMFGTHEGAGGWDCREDCPIGKMIDKNDSLCDHCQLVWAQMSYAQEGEGDGR